MSETIAEIKKKLMHITCENDEYLCKLSEDQRKGVQQLLKQWKKTQQKMRLKIEHFEKMRIFEEECRNAGFQWIAGIDEVGRGPLAGPVVAASVILPTDFIAYEINDSKQLSAAQRESLYEQITNEAISIGIGMMDAAAIDLHNIYQASRLAMLQAVKSMEQNPEFLLIDAMNLPLEIPQKSLIKGDCRSISIAAASIVAKVTRDRMMVDYDQKYPGYGFSSNMGYGTKIHLSGLARMGPCPIHRKSFAPVKNQL